VAGKVLKERDKKTLSQNQPKQARGGMGVFKKKAALQGRRSRRGGAL